MKPPLKKYTKGLIINQFDLEDQQVTEAALEKLLAERVEYLLANRLEFFFAKMYALDIKEDQVHLALKEEKTPSVAIARLIIQRQLEKQITRERYRSETDL